MWFDAVWLNEVLLLTPGLLWWSVRYTPAQRFLDLARTVPLWACVIVHFVSHPIPPYAWVAVVAWTLVANVAQHRLDTHENPPFKEITYILAHVSVLHWLSFSLAGSGVARAIGVIANVAGALYFAAVVTIAVPIGRAWMCYPSKEPSTFNRGYCPQYTGQYIDNPACSYTLDHIRTEYNPRCDPRKWGEYVSVHDAVGHAGHVVGHVLAATLVYHISMIPAATEQARINACIYVASGWKRD